VPDQQLSTELVEAREFQKRMAPIIEWIQDRCATPEDAGSA